jgi:hypothetical protein
MIDTSLKLAAACPFPQTYSPNFRDEPNIAQVEPLLSAEQLKHFTQSIFYYNICAYPLLVAIWVASVFSLRKPLAALMSGQDVEPESLAKARVRTINLPWHIGAVVAIGWIVCIPALLYGLQLSSEPIDQRVLVHLPTSVIIAALITITLAFFIVELIIVTRSLRRDIAFLLQTTRALVV